MTPSLSLASITTHLETLVAGWLGAAAGRPLLGPLNWADGATMLCYLLLAAVVHIGAAVILGRRANALPAAERSGLHRHVLNAAGRPLYIFIWISGIYLAATPVLTKLRPDEGLSALRAALDLLANLGALFSILWFLFRASRVLEAYLAHQAATTASKIDDLLVPLAGTTLRVIVVVLGVILALPVLGLPAQSADIVDKLTSIALISAVAGLLFRVVAISQRVLLSRFDMTVADNLRARRVYTQLHVISRVVYVLIGLFAAAAILMLFQEVRHVGTSLLASAGIVGIIAGFAAQKTLANLFAGFQIALAQPVRQDDVVVVEGEWGRVEEITLSYIVVHIWDDRRLVLPLSYFIEKPFQSWTRTSAALMGTVFVWVDYTFPVAQARAAVQQIVEASPLWDKRYWNLQVTDASERTMQLRILATAADSSRSWDLRCEVREKFIAYIQCHHPDALPRLRTEFSDRARAQAPQAPPSQVNPPKIK